MSFPPLDSRSSNSYDTKQASSKTMFLSPHVAQILAALQPRKPKQRATFLALFLLLCLSSYIFIAQSTSLSPALSLRHSDSPPSDQLALALETIQNARLAGASNKHGLRKGHHHLQHKMASLKLNADEELAAVTSFLASLPQNVIPHTVNPSVPIDPQLVLDFDTKGPRAREEVQAMVEDVWLRNPVFLYSKLYSPNSREIKKILESLYLKPAPTIIEVDVRDDADILLPMLMRLTSAPELPVLLIGGKVMDTSVGNIRALEKTGDLQQLVTLAGAQVNGAKKKKHRK